MISPNDVRTIALSLPESEEKDHWDRRSFRTRKRIFATLQPEEWQAVLKLPLDDQQAMVDRCIAESGVADCRVAAGCVQGPNATDRRVVMAPGSDSRSPRVSMAPSGNR